MTNPGTRQCVLLAGGAHRDDLSKAEWMEAIEAWPEFGVPKLKEDVRGPE